MWDRVDLMSFHRLVPAAEELDLAEEHPQLSYGQVRGLLETELGARPVDD